MSNKPSLYLWFTAAIVILSVFLVFKSSSKLSMTVDEPNHVFCGLEWWQNGTYEAWPENPLLSRLVPSVGPYLDGYRADQFIDPEIKDSETFFINSYNFDYFNSTTLKAQLLKIRIPVMVMFFLSLLIVWYWSYQLGGHKASLLAVGMYASLPIVLAHSGVGTTDITFTTVFILLTWRFIAWLKNPTHKNGIWFGVGLAAGLLTKFSVLPFFFAVMLFVIPMYIIFQIRGKESIFSWIKKIFPSGLTATLLMLFLMWAFHRFSFGAVGAEPVISIGIAEGKFSSLWSEIYVPFPEWFAGLLILLDHNKAGHMAYLLGNISMDGFWYFYPLSYIVKTPWPFLIFTTAGFVGVLYKLKISRQWEAFVLMLIPFGILVSVLPSHINLGLRHILVVYPLLAIGSSIGVLHLLDFYKLKFNWIAFAPIVLVVWQLSVTIIAYPFYISYFNGFAAKEPGKILLDSDLDWSQGLFELVDYCKENKIDTLNVAVFSATPTCLYDFPPLKILDPNTPTHGWVAVSDYHYQGALRPLMLPIDSACTFMLFDFGEPGKAHQGYKWLDEYELKKTIGGSIRMYYIE